MQDRWREVRKMGILTRKQLEDAAKCPEENRHRWKCNADCACFNTGPEVSDCVKNAAQTALSLMDELDRANKAIQKHRDMLKRYEKEWRTGYEINFGTSEIPKTETEYWELVALLKGTEE
jgi:hypothetical protein